jgi:alpha-methylacyl-CoA racemase
MLLADLGADVIVVEKIPAGEERVGIVVAEPLLRGRRSVAVDLKHPDGPEVVLRLAERADVLVEGFRPEVVERLGIGPDECRRRNPRLVYARITGWGREGPLASDAGHDLNYLALVGALHAIGPREGPPVPPLNLVADFGGGGLLAAFGILAALVERERSGLGQVVDTAMIDGAALQTGMVRGMLDAGLWVDERGSNLLDGGAPFYDVYPTAEGGYLAVAALEPRFFAVLLDRLGLDPSRLPAQYDRERWPELRERLGDAIARRTGEEWARVFAGTDGCVTPVLSLGEAAGHPHHRLRGSFVPGPGGVPQPAPAPRFGRTPVSAPRPAPAPGAHTDEVLAEAGLGPDEVAALRSGGAVA